MSKVKAYRCDHCGVIYPDHEVLGILPKEDLFDMLSSFPTTKHPHEAPVHCCLHCFRAFAIQPAENQFNRRFNEAGYAIKLKELSYNVRKTTYLRYIKKPVAKSK